MMGFELSPCISLSRGITNKIEVTVAETGLPGKHMKYFFLPLYVQVAKVVGLPGFMFTRPVVI